MPHQSSGLLELGGLLTSVAGVFLIVYAPGWGERGYRKLATCFFLLGLGLVFAGIVSIIANH
jgi:hypothetical protein